MEADGLLDFSGDSSMEDEPSLIFNNEDSLTNDNSTLTNDELLLRPYSPNYFKISLLAITSLLALLVLVLSLIIRKRDFLKIFVLALLIPILLECGLNIFTEIKYSLLADPVIDQTWTYFYGNYKSMPLHQLPEQALTIFEDIYKHYSTYVVPSSLHFVPLVLYILADYLFWATLFYSLVAFYYAHAAVKRPDDFGYIQYLWSFTKVSLFPILMTLLDVLIALFELSNGVAYPVTILIRFVALITAFALISQAFLSLFVFCSRRDEYVKTSPYDQVRNSKGRLFWYILFQIVVHSLSVPYLAWAALSLTDDFCRTFSIEVDFEHGIATNAFVLHETFFLIRPILVLLFAIVLLAPYRKRFVASFCACCRRR